MFAKRGNPWVTEKDRRQDNDTVSRHEAAIYGASLDYKEAKKNLAIGCQNNDTKEIKKQTALVHKYRMKLTDLIRHGPQATLQDHQSVDMDAVLKAERQRKANPYLTKRKSVSVERSSRDPLQVKLLSFRLRNK